MVIYVPILHQSNVVVFNSFALFKYEISTATNIHRSRRESRYNIKGDIFNKVKS